MDSRGRSTGLSEVAPLDQFRRVLADSDHKAGDAEVRSCPTGA